jgi:tetratricopeptide (TPR) repeat protein
VATLEASAQSLPDDASPRVSLGDLYFEAQRFEEAIEWYDQALALNPADVDAGTNLGVSYYYSDQTERAIETFERSLEVDPSHQRALLSLGIVKAFGLQDLDGAIVVWERVVAIAPDSPEGLAAQDSLDRIRAAHGSSDNDLR